MTKSTVGLLAAGLLLGSCDSSSAPASRAESAECFRLGGTPGWSFGGEGDVLCLDETRFVILLSDGTWDGWDVRWERFADHRRAHVRNVSAVFWDVKTDGHGGWLQADGRPRVPLLPIAAAEADAAQQRLKTADTAECAAALRACFD